MSLVGNLEDLSLPDILQIVSLSRKSGILMLEREGQQGKIIIRQGKVIQTISPRQGKTLGELLTARGLLRPDDLKKALEIQRSGEGRELLGGILVQLKLIDEAALEKVVTEQIEDAIVFFLSWREGTFSFELAEIKGRGEFSVDPQAFILERGIDTQWLVLEGTRMIDERSRERGAAPAPGEAPVEAAGETSFAGHRGRGGRRRPGADPRRRRPALPRDGARRISGGSGSASSSARAARPASPRSTGRPAAASPPAVAADIVMPTMDNQGFLGGLELLEKLRRAHPEVPVVAVTAYPDENVKAQVLELGGQFLLKPGAGEPAAPTPSSRTSPPSSGKGAVAGGSGRRRPRSRRRAGASRRRRRRTGPGVVDRRPSPSPPRRPQSRRAAGRARRPRPAARARRGRARRAATASGGRRARGRPAPPSPGRRAPWRPPHSRPRRWRCCGTCSRSCRTPGPRARSAC